MDLTPDQLQQLQSLGLALTKNPPQNISQSDKSTSKYIPKFPQNSPASLSSTHNNRLLPLFSISGLTLISFGGLLLLKSKESATNLPAATPQTNNTQPAQAPTQVPKSIQHYLLASQQFFTSALQIQQGAQSSAKAGTDLANLINQSIISASEAIKEFPTDYRGYAQRASIYQALIDSKPEFLPQAIADYSQATKLNPGSADLTRSLATLFAKKGDASNTLQYLARTVALEPTKAQNFYDLAKVQEQTGQIAGALESYQKLLTIVADPTQKSQLQNEIASLQKLTSQNPVVTNPSPTTISLPDSPNLIQASLPTTLDSDTGLIIAAPHQQETVTVNNLTDSNALSGSATLTAGQNQISISNQNLTPQSKIYLSIVSGGTNQTLQVLSRSGTTFQAGLDTPISSDIVFKWWIVN